MEKSSLIGGISFTLLVLFVALGYFVYGGPRGALGILILSILWGIATFVSLIPFAGVFLQWLLTNYILSWVMNITGIYPTWLTNVMFWFYVGIGAIATTLISIAVAKKIYKNIKGF